MNDEEIIQVQELAIEKIESLTRQLKVSEDNLGDYRDKLDKAHTKNDRLTKEVLGHEANLRTSDENTNNRLSVLQGRRIDELKGELAERDATIASLTVQVVAQNIIDAPDETIISSKDVTIDNLRIEVARLRGELKGSEGKFGKFTGMESQLNKYIDDCQMLREKNKELKDKLTHSQGDKSPVQDSEHLYKLLQEERVKLSYARSAIEALKSNPIVKVDPNNLDGKILDAIRALVGGEC